MRGKIGRLIAATAIFGVAACSDSATSPSGSIQARGVAPGDRPSLAYNGPQRFLGYRSTTLTLTARGGTYTIGNGLYTLTLPANAVCTLGSSYGPGTWDAPCTTLGAGESVQVTATYGFANGGPVVDFSPELRFSPSAQVTLSTDLYASLLTAGHGYFVAHPEAIQSLGIYYIASLGSHIVADAAVDQSLATHVNMQTGRVWRRIKHFSGYNIASGRACDPSPDDPDCVDSGTLVIVDSR